MKNKIDSIYVCLVPRKEHEVAPSELQLEIQERFAIDSGRIQNINLFEISGVNSDDVSNFAEKVLFNPVKHSVIYDIKQLDQLECLSFALISKRHGVTDDKALTIKEAMIEFLQLNGDDFSVKTKELFLFQNKIDNSILDSIATKLLSNPLVHSAIFSGKVSESLLTNSIFSDSNVSGKTEFVALDKDVSNKRHLGFSDEEIDTVLKQYKNETFQKIRKSKGLPELATDCEIELIAQTWSEHCKHKEFSAKINYLDQDNNTSEIITSLFNTYVRGSTKFIKEELEKNGHDWLVKVFNDNAGIVKVNKDNYFVWKVETHNSPSLLDPYGGAITGVLGCNRDAMGTGMGGAQLLFNTNVLCFGPPSYNKPLLNGQKHPKQILSGVVKGIIDGGNKSGIPTVNGAIHFDDRYSGKPLVFCGTGALMKAVMNGKATHHKEVDVGDYIVMAGGRVGQDGIHGATLSSIQMDNETPGSMVQIGSPITQKKLSDFLEEACRQGLVKTCTDNGAGGLGSSVGEIACVSGGARVDLDKVPLKYKGLSPWEILVSESQERMTIVVDPKTFIKFKQLAEFYQVEVSLIGEFKNHGWLDMFYNGECVGALPLDFLHDGVPTKVMDAIWKSPINESNTKNKHLLVDTHHDFNNLIIKLLGSYNICSRESIIRQYDHEVKANTVVKPLMGATASAPQDAAVIRVSQDSYEALVVSNGMMPRIGDVDPYNMSAASFDEAVRQIISVGGELPDLSKPNSNFWSVNDNFCLPNCAYDKVDNPDGPYKMAQLVHMCKALYDYSTYFLIPMTSGKDSMKNDFIDQETKTKISIPPTVLYSCVSKIDDFRKVTTSHFKQAEDLIYVLGHTYNEMAGSELCELLNIVDERAPIVRMEEAKRCYNLVSSIRKEGMLLSCHDVSDGGIAIAAIESTFGAGFGVDLVLPKMNGDKSPLVWLFSESPSRFVVSIKTQHKQKFEELCGDMAQYIGKVTHNPYIKISSEETLLVNLTTEECIKAWKSCDL